MRKLTHEEYEKRLLEDGRGFIALEEYKGASKPILHQCPAGHLHTARPSDLLSGKGCRECANEVMRQARSLTHEDYEAWLESEARGWKVLGRYHNNHTAIKHLCPEGHEVDMSPSKLKSGRGCRICSNRVPLTAEDYQSYLSSDPRGFVAVQPYAGLHTKITHRCAVGHEWDVVPASIRHGDYGCPHCSGYIPQDYAEVLAEDGRGYIALAEYMGGHSPILHRCPEGHEWKASPNNIKRGKGCPECAEYGFNPSKPAILYVAEHDIGGVMLVNVGITNRAFEERYTGGDLKTVIRHEEFSGDGRFIASLECLVVEALAPNLASGALGLRMKKGTKECFDIPYETALAEVRRLISEAA